MSASLRMHAARSSRATMATRRAVASTSARRRASAAAARARATSREALAAVSAIFASRSDSACEFYFYFFQDQQQFCVQRTVLGLLDCFVKLARQVHEPHLNPLHENPAVNQHQPARASRPCAASPPISGTPVPPQKPQ